MSGPVGLVLVHGIGRQARGAMLRDFLAAWSLVVPDTAVTQRDPLAATLVLPDGRTIHVHEAWWAGELTGDLVRGTFEADAVYRLAWFPSLNRAAGLLDTRVHGGTAARLWTVVLPPAAAFLSLALWGLRVVGIVPGAALRLGDEPRPARESLARLRRLATGAEPPDESYGPVERILDDFAGDVVNYVNSAGGLPPPRPGLAGVATRITDAVRAAAATAADDGCTELQVLAHSLGTVVAWHALAGVVPADAPTPAANPGAMRLTRLYTIGSPLEKIRFFWPRLAAVRTERPVLAASGRVVAEGGPDFRWLNFHGVGDPVSGRLRPFGQWGHPENHRIPGLGGLATAHVRYTQNPRFLAALTEGLTGAPRAPTISAARRAWAATRATAENLLLPVILVALVLLGAGFAMASGHLSGWLLGAPLRALGYEAAARALQLVLTWSMLAGLTAVGALAARIRLREEHATYWARLPAGAPTP